MAHYALIGADNIVKTVIVVANENEPTEAAGIAWCTGFGERAGLSVPGDYWLKTSYSATLRKNFAGAGYAYDAGRDAFVPPRPSDDYVLNEETCRWELP